MSNPIERGPRRRPPRPLRGPALSRLPPVPDRQRGRDDRRRDAERGGRVGAVREDRIPSSALASVGLVQALPVLLLSLPAGHLADRFVAEDQSSLGDGRGDGCRLARAGGGLVLAWPDRRGITCSSVLIGSGAGRSASRPGGPSCRNWSRASVFHNAVTWRSAPGRSPRWSGRGWGARGSPCSRGRPPSTWRMRRAGWSFCAMIAAIRARPAATSRDPMTLDRSRPGSGSSGTRS